MSSHCRFYGGLPPAFVDLQELYIKVCESVTEGLGKADFEGEEEKERCGNRERCI